MKKLLGIVVLSFFLNTNLFANTWNIKEQKDEFKGTSFKYVISNWVKPNKPLDFPYEDLKVKFYKFCGNNEVVGLIFNMEPNIRGGDIESDHYSYLLDAKLDDNFEKVYGELDFGDKELIIRYGAGEKILKSKLFMIQLKHYNGLRHYKFDLNNLPIC